jgi:hypothetical protein
MVQYNIAAAEPLRCAALRSAAILSVENLRLQQRHVKGAELQLCRRRLQINPLLHLYLLMQYSLNVLLLNALFCLVFAFYCLYVIYI